MNIFRTCRIKTSMPALKFLKNKQDLSAVIKFLNSQEMIDEVFNRPLPIPKQHASRFGPEGFMYNVLYASHSKETTLFEYGFHLLKESSLLNISVYANTYVLSLKKETPILDIKSISTTLNILDHRSYTDSNAWIGLQNMESLKILKYPSVRQPHHNGLNLALNFALFNKDSVVGTEMNPDTFILTAHTNGTVIVQNSLGVKDVIAPII